jgi:hypothetical protein
MKEKFKVSVVRIGYSYIDLEIEAANETEATILALEKAVEIECDEDDAEYKASFVIPINENK